MATTQQENQIAEFNITDAALQELENKYSVAPDASTEDGYVECKKSLSVLRPLRTGIEKMRLSLNSDDQAQIKLRNTEAKRITTRLIALENPIKAAKDFVDAEAKRIEDEKRQIEVERIELHKSNISVIQQIYPNSTIDAIDAQIADVDLYEPTLFEEFTEQAQIQIELKRDQLVRAKQSLVDLNEQRLENERIAKQLDKQAAEIKAQQDAIEQKKLDAQNSKLEAERVEAAKIKAEKDQLERAEQGRIAVLKGVAVKEAERLRLEALKPDIDKIQDWCKQLQALIIPEIDDQKLRRDTQQVKGLVFNATQDLINELVV